MSYSPQPGTIAFRAIAWLEKQPAGTEVTASMWAEEIGTDGNTLGVCLKPAVDGGWVKRFTRNGMSKPLWFSLGSGRPPPRVEDEDDRDPLPRRTKAPDVQPAPGALLPGGVRGDEPVPPAPPPKPAPAASKQEPKPEAATPRPFDCWLSGVTGEMVLQGVTVDADGDVVLPPAAVTALRRALLGVNA